MTDTRDINRYTDDLLDAARIVEGRRLADPWHQRGGLVTRATLRTAVTGLADLLDTNPAWDGAAPAGTAALPHGGVACAILGLARLESWNGTGAGLPRADVAAALREASAAFMPIRSRRVRTAA